MKIRRNKLQNLLQKREKQRIRIRQGNSALGRGERLHHQLRRDAAAELISFRREKHVHPFEALVRQVAFAEGDAVADRCSVQ